jgi:hypothetical protein
MSSNVLAVFTKDNLDTYLKELAKEFRKLNGTAVHAEIILIGGAAILANYGFRDMTTDIDAVIHATSYMKDAINRVGDKFDLPNGWLNSDFTRTSSYSAKLDEISVYYKTYSNVLNIRTVSAEYLIAMKLQSGRKYKNDLSDIIGILSEHQKLGHPITLETISSAVVTLYGSWHDIPNYSRDFIEKVMHNNNYEQLYRSILWQEKLAREMLIDFNSNHDDAVVESNADDIIASLKRKKLK